MKIIFAITLFIYAFNIYAGGGKGAVCQHDGYCTSKKCIMGFCK